MPADHLLLWLLGGAAVVLALASAGGLVLARRHPGSASVVNYNDRVRAWWAMVAVLAAAFLSGPIGTILLFAGASAVVLREYLAVATDTGRDRLAVIAAYALVLPIQYALVAADWYGLFSIFIPVYGFLFLPILATLRGAPEGFLARVASLHWGLMVAVFCLSHVPALTLIEIPGREGREILLVAFLVIVVEASDVSQYLWGKALGRTKLAPRLSPSKTVEGLAGGLLTACGIGAGLWWMTPFTPGEAFLMSLAITVTGFFGGLVMSAIKRDRGVKDWGSLIPGHGGMLDRLDALLFAAPVFFHLTRYFWAA